MPVARLVATHLALQASSQDGELCSIPLRICGGSIKAKVAITSPAVTGKRAHSSS